MHPFSVALSILAGLRAAAARMAPPGPAHAARPRWRSALVLLGIAGLAGAALGQGREIDQRSRYTFAQDQTFSQYIGSRLPHTAYSFGAVAQVPWAENGFAIRSLAELAQHFNPLEDFTGAVTINGELQVYPAAFNPTDHRMGDDRLAFWANLPGGEWKVRFGSQSDNRLGWPLDGSPIAWNRIPAGLLPHAAEWRVGQFVALQNRGIYFISEIQPGVSLRLAALMDSPRTGEFLFNLAAFLPVDSAISLNPAPRGTMSLQFAPGALSRNIQVGHRVAITATDAAVRNGGDVSVAAIDHATGAVLLNRAMPLAVVPAGQRFVFYPRITSGQAWTKRQWDITHPSAFLAVEFDISLFDGLSPAFEPAGISGGAAFERLDAAYPDAPFGAWPALWAYSADDGDPTKFRGTSELDFMELWVSTNSGMRLYSSSNVGGTSVWTRNGGGYSVTANERHRVPYSMAGSHKVAVVYTGQKTYHYLDDVLVRVEVFRWQSQSALQIGLNLAMGSLNKNFAANMNFPFRPENFKRAHMDVKAMRVWHRAQ